MALIRKPPGRSVRLLLALLFVVAGLVAVSAATPQPAQALTTCATPAPVSDKFGGESAAEPTYNFTPHVSCHTLAVPASYKCNGPQAYGGSGLYAWECAELYVDTVHSGNPPYHAEIYAVGSFFCTNSAATIVNCGLIDDASAGIAIKYPAGTNPTMVDAVDGALYTCSGNCPSTTAVQVSSVHYNLYTNEQCAEIWAGDDNGLGSPIIVGGHSFTGSFYGPHVNICAGDQVP